MNSFYSTIRWVLTVCCLLTADMARGESLTEADHKKLLRELETQKKYEQYIRYAADHAGELDESIRAKSRLYQLKLQQSDPLAGQAALLEQLVPLYDQMISAASADLILFSPASPPEGSGTAAGPPSLSPALQAMLEENQTDLLDWMLEVTQIRLLQQAGGYQQQLEFYADQPQETARQNLTGIVTWSDSYLKIAKGAIEDLLKYMEWYPGTDWKERFGDTQWYVHVQELQKMEQWYSGILWYYKSCLEQAQPQESAETTDRLKEAFDTLENMRQAAAGPRNGEGLHLAIWQIRMSERLIATEPRYFEYAQKLVKNLLAKSPGADWEYEIRYAWAGCELAACRAKPQDGTAILAQLKKWLEQEKKQVTNLPEKLWQVALLEKKYSDRQATADLKKLADEYPSLRGRIHTLMAAQLAQSLAGADDPQKAAGELDDFSLVVLGQYYLSQPQPDYEKALQVYEAFLLSRSAEQEDYPQALYNAGLCSYQLSEKKASPELAVQAIQYWRRLARDFPLWLSQTNPQQQNSQQAAVMAATLAYQLFSADTKTYAAVAREAITGLTGTIDPNQAEPAGPYDNCKRPGSFATMPAWSSSRAKNMPLPPLCLRPYRGRMSINWRHSIMPSFA